MLKSKLSIKHEFVTSNSFHINSISYSSMTISFFKITDFSLYHNKLHTSPYLGYHSNQTSISSIHTRNDNLLSNNIQNKNIIFSSKPVSIFLLMQKYLIKRGI